MQIGLTYDQTLNIPLGELLNLIAIEQIKHEGAKLKQAGAMEYDGELSEQEAFEMFGRW